MANLVIRHARKLCWRFFSQCKSISHIFHPELFTDKVCSTEKIQTLKWWFTKMMRGWKFWNWFGIMMRHFSVYRLYSSSMLKTLGDILYLGDLEISKQLGFPYKLTSNDSWVRGSGTKKCNLWSTIWKMPRPVVVEKLRTSPWHCTITGISNREFETGLPTRQSPLPKLSASEDAWRSWKEGREGQPLRRRYSAPRLSLESWVRIRGFIPLPMCSLPGELEHDPRLKLERRNHSSGAG